MEDKLKIITFKFNKRRDIVMIQTVYEYIMLSKHIAELLGTTQPDVIIDGNLLTLVSSSAIMTFNFVKHESEPW